MCMNILERVWAKCGSLQTSWCGGAQRWRLNRCWVLEHPPVCKKIWTIALCCFVKEFLSQKYLFLQLFLPPNYHVLKKHYFLGFKTISQSTTCPSLRFFRFRARLQGLQDFWKLWKRKQLFCPWTRMQKSILYKLVTGHSSFCPYNQNDENNDLIDCRSRIDLQL